MSNNTASKEQKLMLIIFQLQQQLMLSIYESKEKDKIIERLKDINHK